jgi:hypothetical protein
MDERRAIAMAIGSLSHISVRVCICDFSSERDCVISQKEFYFYQISRLGVLANYYFLIFLHFSFII